MSTRDESPSPVPEPASSTTAPKRRDGRQWWLWVAGLAILAGEAPELYTAAAASAHQALMVAMGLVLVLLGASRWRGDEEAGRDWLWCLLWVIWFVMLTRPGGPTYVGRLWPSVVAAYDSDAYGTVLSCGLVVAFAIAAAGIGLRVGLRTLGRRRTVASER